MSLFWFSRKNLIRVISNVMSLFKAVDSDMDQFQEGLSDLDDRVEALEMADDPVSDLIKDPGEVDIDNSTETITQRTSAATIVTTFESDVSQGIDTITSNITMNSGDYDYIRTTTITEDGTTDKIRTTIQKIEKE